MRRRCWGYSSATSTTRRSVTTRVHTIPNRGKPRGCVTPWSFGKPLSPLTACGPSAQVVPHITKLGDLRELASATDNESFMLSYQVVLRANPAVTPQVVDRLLASREDISRSDRAGAVKTCQEVYEGMLLNAR